MNRLGRFWHRLEHTDWTLVRKKWSYRGLKLLNFVCAVHLFADHVGFIHHVAGPSMVPTMSVNGEMVVENRWIKPEQLSRGDLITFISPLDPRRMVCKRLIGLPGDIICVDPTGQLAPSTEHVVVPKGHVWISGDNAEVSRDSRCYGPVSMALIKGKLVARIWPWRDRGWFRSNYTYIDAQSPT